MEKMLRAIYSDRDDDDDDDDNDDDSADDNGGCKELEGAGLTDPYTARRCGLGGGVHYSTQIPRWDR